jgi:hypothetical protein
MSGFLASPSPFGGTPNAGRSKQVEDHREQAHTDIARLKAQVEDLAALRKKVDVLETKVDGLKEALPSNIEHKELTDYVSREAFENLREKVTGLEGVVTTGGEATAGEAFHSAESNHDDESDKDVEEHPEEKENDGANTLMASADHPLMALIYEQFPQHRGKNLITICQQAAPEGAPSAQATASIVSSSRPSTNTRASQRTQASAKPKKFFVQLKLWTVDRAGGQFFGGREIMEIWDNSTLRDLEIQVENHVKDIQDGDINKRANLKDPSVFYWSTEHVVENIKAMKHMDADEHTWSGVDEAVIISKENVKGTIDWLKRETQMPWLSVTIKLKDSSER